MPNKKPVIVYDEQTGQHVVVYQNPASQTNYQIRPYDYPTPQVRNYPPPARRRRRSNMRRKEKYQREEKARFAGGWFFVFAASWGFSAAGYPGLTLLTWAVLAGVVFYRALR